MAPPISAFAKLLAGRAKPRASDVKARAATAPPAPKRKAAEAAPDVSFLHLLKGARERQSALNSAGETHGGEDALPKPGTAAFLLAAGRMRRGEAKAAAADRAEAPQPGTAAFLMAAGRMRRGEP